MEEFVYFGNTPFTQEEIDALDKAVEDAKGFNTPYHGIYHLLENRGRKKGHPEFAQYQIDAYLEARGLKASDVVVPPRTLSGGYTLDEKYIKGGELLPSWWTRGDGAVLYMHRWWSTTAPAEGWREYAWFQVESALKYEQVSEWKPIEHYMHKRRYWKGSPYIEYVDEHPVVRHPTYSTIVERGEIDLG